jgi:hypothetical protein
MLRGVGISVKAIIWRESHAGRKVEARIRFGGQQLVVWHQKAVELVPRTQRVPHATLPKHAFQWTRPRIGVFGGVADSLHPADTHDYATAIFRERRTLGVKQAQRSLGLHSAEKGVEHYELVPFVLDPARVEGQFWLARWVVTESQRIGLAHNLLTVVAFDLPAEHRSKWHACGAVGFETQRGFGEVPVGLRASRLIGLLLLQD